MLWLANSYSILLYSYNLFKAGSHFPLSTNITELKTLGDGYPMYYALKKNLTWLLFILSIIAGIPCTILSYALLIKHSDLDIEVEYPFISKLSVGNVFIMQEVLKDDNVVMYADIIVYLNAVAIIYLLGHSIYLRRMLIKYNMQLDADATTPSDFTLIARNLPLDLT